MKSTNSFLLNCWSNRADIFNGFCFCSRFGGSPKQAVHNGQALKDAGYCLREHTLARYFQGCFLLAIFLILALPGFVPNAAAERVTVSLAGEWQIALGEPKPSEAQQALPRLRLNDTIRLPGTTDTAKKGPENQERATQNLTRLHKWNGPVWYERAITVPESFRGKRTTLFLERTKYTQLWVDGKPRGENAILCTPQEYSLGLLEPGQHRLTLMIDNTRKPVNAEAHQFSDNTQGNWNGVIGRMELVATDLVWLEDIQIFPDVSTNRLQIQIKFGNFSGKAGQGAVDIVTKGSGYAQNRSGVPVSWDNRGGTAEIELPLTESAKKWDEFHPALHTLTVKLNSQNANDERQVSFGLREFTTHDGQFVINGRTTFLRGKHDACVFPLTGHPPMDVDGWLKYLNICRDYGINHIRCHTWVPPEAAFTAADQLGMYLEPELPFWGTFTEDIRRALTPEAMRVLKFYGNHPSFVMMSLGNELGGSREVMGAFVRDLRKNDPRRLYAQGSNNYFWDPKEQDSDDFWTTVRTRVGGVTRNVRGSFAMVDGGNGHIQVGPPGTTNNYSNAIASVKIPVVGHEIGQYTVYPDFREISKYTGVFRARNFELFRQKLNKTAMSEQPDDFFHASGKLAALCYREEIEAALRTPGFGGFQLLDLQDFPGQGTALVGILNAFMDSKGAISADKWRQFCAPVVPLACFDRYVWTSNETFTADVRVAHYGEKDIAGGLEWTIFDKARKISSGSFSATIKQGGLRDFGRISVPLRGASVPTMLTLNLYLPATRGYNSYPIWVYPEALDTTPPSAVTVSRVMDASTRAALTAGDRVVVIPLAGALSRTVGGGFATDFWCWPMFHNKPGTMGILCDPKHPALAGFPTEDHSDWQWFNLLAHSQPLMMEDLPKDLEPIVQVIDNLDRNSRLGLIFEGKVGSGKLLVCATDLLSMQDQPEARQLLRSLLNYAASDKFAPRHETSIYSVRKTLSSNFKVVTATATSSRSDRFSPARAADGDPATRWCANTAGPNQWFQADLGATREVNGCRIQWETVQNGYAYILEGSEDGAIWNLLSDRRNNDFKDAHNLVFPSAKARYLRIYVTGLPAGQSASICEFSVFGME